MTGRKFILGLVAALPLAVFGGSAGWQAVASADTDASTAAFDCCDDPTCPPGCDIDCPPDCDVLRLAETVNKPTAPKACDGVTACCRFACVKD